MNLENISYIFGIIGSIATVVALYYARKAHVLKRTGGGPKADPVEKEKKKELFSELQNETQVDSLEMAFETAKKIFKHEPRDKALAGVARKAAVLSNWKLAIEICEEMFYHANKDSVLREICEIAVKKKEWKAADAASDLMYYYSNLDSTKRMISYALSG